MRTMIASVVVSILLGGVTVGAAQLPPEIMVDRYLLQAEQLMAGKDHKAALETMGQITALQKEHDLTLPEEFHFKYAQVALAVFTCLMRFGKDTAPLIGAVNSCQNTVP